MITTITETPERIEVSAAARGFLAASEAWNFAKLAYSQTVEDLRGNTVTVHHRSSEGTLFAVSVNKSKQIVRIELASERTKPVSLLN